MPLPVGRRPLHDSCGGSALNAALFGDLVGIVTLGHGRTAGVVRLWESWTLRGLLGRHRCRRSRGFVSKLGAKHPQGLGQSLGVWGRRDAPNKTTRTIPMINSSGAPRLPNMDTHLLEHKLAAPQRVP